MPSHPRDGRIGLISYHNKLRLAVRIDSMLDILGQYCQKIYTEKYHFSARVEPVTARILKLQATARVRVNICT